MQRGRSANLPLCARCIRNGLVALLAPGFSRAVTAATACWLAKAIQSNSAARAKACSKGAASAGGEILITGHASTCKPNSRKFVLSGPFAGSSRVTTTAFVFADAFRFTAIPRRGPRAHA
jgi:hypothetical protein